MLQTLGFELRVVFLKLFFLQRTLWCCWMRWVLRRLHPCTHVTIHLYLCCHAYKTLSQFIHKFNLQSFLAEAWYRGRLNKLDGGMRRDPGVGGVLLIMQWLRDAVGERGKSQWQTGTWPSAWGQACSHARVRQSPSCAANHHWKHNPAHTPLGGYSTQRREEGFVGGIYDSTLKNLSE